MARTLIVVYSYTGTSRRLAERLASQQGWPIGEIRDRLPRGTLRCVLDSLFRRRPAIGYAGPTPADFETVVLVSPIWVNRLAGPMRSFVHASRGQLRQVVVLSTMGSKGAATAEAEVAAILGHPTLLAAAFTAIEVLDNRCAARLQAVGDALAAASRGELPIHGAIWFPQAG